MAVKASIATGNFTAAGTWGTVDSTSYLNEENATESLLTTAYSGTTSSAFTPGAIEISHIGVKLAERIGTTGTMSVVLQLDSDNSDVAGTEVTINTADLPSALEADLNGGWIFFKLSSPVTLSAATAYQLAAKTSSATQVDLFCSSVADNLSRALVTTTTAAPGAGDDLIIAGEKTGAGTGNDFTVTMDETASTDYGAASTSLVTPAIAICDGGTLTCGVGATTAYVLKVSGNFIVYSGGVLNTGTSGSPMPTGSSLEITIDCASNVEFGIVIRNLGTWTGRGTKAFTASPNSNHFTVLTADEAAAQTVIGAVGDTTGWEADDEICFSSTTRTTSEHQLCKIASIDSGTAFTLSTTGTLLTGATPASLASAKSGTNDANGDIRCRIGNITRNVRIRGVSTTLGTYIDIKATAIIDIEKVEFRFMGSATASKRGIDIATTASGSFNMQYCSFANFEVSSAHFIVAAGTTHSGWVLSNNVFYSCSNAINVAATTGTWTIHNNLVVRANGGAILLADVGGTFTDNFLNIGGASGSSYILQLSETNGVIGTMSGNSISCGNGDPALSVTGNITGNIESMRVYRNGTANSSSAGVKIIMPGSSQSGILTFTDLIAFGNTTTNVGIQTGNVRFVNASIQGGVTLATSYGIKFSPPTNSTSPTNPCRVEFEGGEIGTVNTHTADLIIPAANLYPIAVFHGTEFGSSVEIEDSSNIGLFGSITSLKHDAVAGAFRAVKTGGRADGWHLENDTTIYNTASPSLKMYPGSATINLESPTFYGFVTSGSTLTPSIYVRESVVGDGTDYNGNRIRLWVRRNVAMGISADTVLDTATGSSEGAFEQLTGTTAAVTDTGVLEFFVTCDGTTGWANIDDFTCTSDASSGLGYWSGTNAGPLAVGVPASGGSGGSFTFS